MKKRKSRSAEDLQEPGLQEQDRSERDPQDETPTPAVTLVEPVSEAEVTEVTAAPDEDEWDDPTREVEADQLAALTMQSATAPAEENPSQASADGESPAEPLVVSGGRLENVIESLLFASDRPLMLNELKRMTGEREGAKITMALEMLRSRRQDTGIQVIPVAGGWHLRTHPDNVAWVSRLVAAKPQRLSRALLETLAIVAYRQPVTRPEIDEIRGVDCGPVLGTLLERGLIRMIGKKEEVGRPILYGTTPEFLRTFSLRDLTELPTLREFHELNEAEMAKVDAEAPPRGAEGEGSAADPAAEAKPSDGKGVPARRELDPEEDDELLSELERAAGAAAKATSAVAESKPAGRDEPAGSAD
jgi:segregation and condensation protein B